MTYVATFSKPQLTATNPVYVTSGGTTARQFYGWTRIAGMFSPDTVVAFHHKDTTVVSYNATNDYYLQQSYRVGNYEYVTGAFKSGSLKLK